MKWRDNNRLNVPRAAAPALLCVVLLIMAVGASLAHYEVRLADEEYPLEIAETEPVGNRIYIFAPPEEEDVFERPEDWITEQTVEGKTRSELRFVLANGISDEEFSGDDQRAFVQVIMTSGLDDTEKMEVSVTDGETSFPGTIERIRVGTVQYFQYGPGWIVRFRNEAEEELQWELPGGMLYTKELMLSVEYSDEPANDTMLTLIAVAAA